MLRKIFLGSLIVLVILVMTIFFYFFYLGGQSKSRQAIGVVNGLLAKCPNKPNCVTSEFREDRAYFIEPFMLPNMSVEDTMATIVSVIEKSGGTVISRKSHYVAATFTSNFFGFVDDLEFRLDEASGLIHIRSASRVGYSDFGQNRKRVMNIKQLLLIR